MFTEKRNKITQKYQNRTQFKIILIKKKLKKSILQSEQIKWKQHKQHWFYFHRISKLKNVENRIK